MTDLVKEKNCKKRLEKLKLEYGRVILNEKRHQELLKAEKKLIALENYGVENWEGYDEAMDNMKND